MPFKKVAKGTKGAVVQVKEEPRSQSQSQHIVKKVVKRPLLATKAARKV